MKMISPARAFALATILMISVNIVGGWQAASAQSAQEPTAPLATCPDEQCFADVPPDNPFFAFANNLYRQDIVTGYTCGGPGEPCDAQNRPYYRPGNTVTRQQMSKFVDQARTMPGISISTTTDIQPLSSRSSADLSTAMYGESTGSNGTGLMAVADNGVFGYGVWGLAAQGIGVVGSGDYGVSGYSTGADTAGVYGTSSGGYGVRGSSNTSYAAVLGDSTANNGAGVAGLANTGANAKGIYGISSGGWAGYFEGNLRVTGACTGCLDTMQIDHPLDPEHSYLNHAGVASSDRLNIYNGNALLDNKGEAVVTLPDYFETLNRDFRYQLTTVGGFAPVYIAEKVHNNRFKIAGGTPGLEVSWQVTGVRHDPYAEQHPIEATTSKAPDEQNLYLHPEAYGQPESKGIGYEQRQKFEQAEAPSLQK